MKPGGVLLIVLALSQSAPACCTPTPQIDLTKLIATIALFLFSGPAFGALVSEGVFQAMGRRSDFWRFALSLAIGLFAAAAAAFVLIWSGPLVILTPLISAGVSLGVSQASERTDQPEQQ